MEIKRRLSRITINGFIFDYDCILNEEKFRIEMKLCKFNNYIVSYYFERDLKEVEKMMVCPDRFINEVVKYFDIGYNKEQFTTNLKYFINNNILTDLKIKDYISSMHTIDYDFEITDDNFGISLKTSIIPLIYDDKLFIYVDYTLNNDSNKNNFIIKTNNGDLTNTQIACDILNRIVEQNPNVVVPFDFVNRIANVIASAEVKRVK